MWRNCIIKHLNIANIWRNADADRIKPAKQDIFWVEASLADASYLMSYVHDEDHISRIRFAIKGVQVSPRKMNFIVSRNGLFVQYYPMLSFDSPGIKWEKVHPFSFSSFAEMNKKIPVVAEKIYCGDL
jgi:hypothetical protein